MEAVVRKKSPVSGPVSEYGVITHTRTDKKAPRAKVRIEAEDFASAKMCDASDCLFAKAIIRTFAERGIQITYVLVDVQTIRFSVPAWRLRFTYMTPRTVQEAILLFDMGQTPQPFSFMLSGSVQIRGMRAIPAGTSGKPASAKQREGRDKGIAAMHRARGVVKRDGGSTVPDVQGGSPIPVIPGNRRRTYGLRAFDRLPTDALDIHA